jgi:peptide deformylase
MKVLSLRQFGDPILRQKAKLLTHEDLQRSEIRQLITDMQHTSEVKKYGVGLAAPQVGVSVAVAVIMIKPTAVRPDAGYFRQVIINPSYLGVGRRRAMWEGCLSTGFGRNTLFGKALRYARIQAAWLDENGNEHHEELTGLPAHVFQHETDHLNGVLFVDRVKDTTSYMMEGEYRKVVKGNT